MHAFGRCVFIVSARVLFCSSKPLFSRQDFRQFSSFRKMASERNRDGRRNSRGRRSPYVPESHSTRESGSFRGGHIHQKYMPSSAASGIHAERCSPNGDPPHGQMSQGKVAGGCTSKHPQFCTGDANIDSAIDNRAHCQQTVPIKKNEKWTEHKFSKDTVQLKSNEPCSLQKFSISQKDGPSSGDDGGSPVGGTHYGKFLQDSMLSGSTVQRDQRPERCSGMSYFDICPPVTVVKLSPSLLSINKERRKERESSMSVVNVQYFQKRPGMILIKNYLRHSEQVEIIKQCRELGIGSGGFYQPVFSGGAKMHLWMMCLGKNWDPETRSYGETRPTDDAKPPGIPDGFKSLVKRAIHDSHSFMKTISKESSVEAVLPNMTPDICIVNFYTKSGKLGLHQDQDESQESLRKGLPVVSFSFGDTAEFLFGDDRNVDTAEKVKLESGDVLIFGGKSRHIFHGVPCIFPETAPKRLVNEMNLIPGRLNLTFRQY